MERPRYTIVLTGNPNAGKSSLFNALTGARQHVGNYPGVTVDKKEILIFLEGEIISVVDLPGTYSLTAYSLEEVVARNYIINERPNVVINVIDASNLERNLYLTVQLMEVGIPLVICLNMIDVANERNIYIDEVKLSQLLKVPIVPTIARKGYGIKELLRVSLSTAREMKKLDPLNISYRADIDAGITELVKLLLKSRICGELYSVRWLAVKCLEGDSTVLDTVEKDDRFLGYKIISICQRIVAYIKSVADDDLGGVIADCRYGYINSIISQIMVNDCKIDLNLSDKIDKVITNRIFGPIFLLSVLYIAYQFVFWVSQGPVHIFENFFIWMGLWVQEIIPEGLLRSLIVDGIIAGIGGVIGFTPLIMLMFFIIAIMEDSGYMARMAYLLDRIFRFFGLHGNSVIALIVGGGISGGCAVLGVMATRTLQDPHIRLATILVVPFMSCGAKIPIYSLLIGAFFIQFRAEIMMGITLFTWILSLFAAYLLRSTILKGKRAPFVMELPPYRLPSIKSLFIHTWERSWEYFKRAGGLLLVISIIVWGFMTFPGLDEASKIQFKIKREEARDIIIKQKIQEEEARENLSKTIAGYAGRMLTLISTPIGFDWQTNVALVGGLAAKEVIVSTLGTAYSLGEIKNKIDKDQVAEISLSDKLKYAEGWNSLRAIALIIFVTIYSPCLATLAIIRRETGGWRWPIFSVIYNTLIAYIITFIVYQGGRILGFG